MILEAESYAQERRADILGRIKSTAMVQDISCGPMDFCRKIEYFKKSGDEISSSLEQQALYFSPVDCLDKIKECYGDLPARSMSRLIGESGVIGGFGLAAGLLGRKGNSVRGCTSSRGGIVAETEVSR